MYRVYKHIARSSTIQKPLLAIIVALFTATAAIAQGGGNPPKESSIYNPFVVTMLIIMIILLLVIGLLANVVVGASHYYYSKKKEELQKEKGGSAVVVMITGLLLFGSMNAAVAQGPQTTVETLAATDLVNGVSATAFWFMISVVAMELLVIFTLLYQLRVFLAKEKVVKEEGIMVPAKPRNDWWNKLNRFKPVEQEAQIDLGHEYDGIRELDNRLPPWWLYGFYACILFAVVYLWRYHVSHSAPLSGEELQIAMRIADEQNAAYLKKAASNVDETTVKLLTNAEAISSGEIVFKQNCAACHGKAGEGIVGPNLTDDYWLHGGSIKDIFKTIKYGWPEKGMRSWKEDLRPVQIEQVVSYIKSIHGTNPPNGKEKQGDLYTEETPAKKGGMKDSSITKSAIAVIQ